MVEGKPLLSIINVSEGLKLRVRNDTLDREEEVNKMFVVVRNVKSMPKGDEVPRFSGEYPISKGDVIKMGRLKFLVRDFRSPTTQANFDCDAHCSPVKKNLLACENEEEQAQEEEVEIECGIANDSQIQCKICWSDEQSIENPLLCSCKCDGSVRYIHYACLKHWLKQKMTLKEEPACISYTWKQFECEICKTPYPYVFKT